MNRFAATEPSTSTLRRTVGTRTAEATRSSSFSEWPRIAGPWSVLLHASPIESARVSAGVPYTLVSANGLRAASLLGRVVGECEHRWGSTPPGGHVPICPHIRASLQRRAVWVGCVEPMPDPASLSQAVLPILDLFDGLEAISGKTLTSVVIVVPYVDPVAGSAIVESTQRAIKSAALQCALLPGEFGRKLDGPGSRYPDIATRKSEVGEYLAIRRVLRQDRKYCEREPLWLDQFEAIFGRAS
jgi:hypothetical protein